MTRFLIITIIILSTAVNGLMAQKPRHDNGPDNVLQYTPYAAVFIMKAAGADNGHDWTRTAVNAATSLVVSSGVTYILKHSVSELRPDHSDRHSFPSGHTTVAFSGATVLHHEYGHLSPWVSIGGYAVATLTGADRVWRNRHHWHDVAAGAAIGILGTELSYLATDRLFRRLFPQSEVSMTVTGNGLEVALYF